MSKFEMVCQTCNSVTKNVDFRYSVIYDMIIVVKCSQCNEEEKYYWDMQKVEE
jgi:RNase P subunit RPR2